MAYDDELAFRIQVLLAGETNLDSTPMFGGLAFLINGNIAVAASSRGGLMVRVPPEQTEALLEYPHTTPMIMAGRETRGWVRVSGEGIRSERQLTRWVTLGADYARRLPAK